MKRPKYITVRWRDHYEEDGTWAEPTPPAELKGASVESRGWLISENEECIQLSSHRPLDVEDLTWGRPFAILKAAIVSRSDKKIKGARLAGKAEQVLAPEPIAAKDQK